MWTMLLSLVALLLLSTNPANGLSCFSAVKGLSSCTSFLRNPSPVVPDSQCCHAAVSLHFVQDPCECLRSQAFLPSKLQQLPHLCNLNIPYQCYPSLDAVPNDLLTPLSMPPLESPEAVPGGVEPPQPDSPLQPLPNFPFPPFPNFPLPPFPNFPLPPFPNFPLPPLPNFPFPPFPSFPIPPLPNFPIPPLPFVPPPANLELQKTAQSSDVATDGLLPLPPLPNLPLPPLPKLPLPPLIPVPPLANLEEKN